MHNNILMYNAIMVYNNILVYTGIPSAVYNHSRLKIRNII